MKKKLKTKTIGSQDNPSLSILKGRHSVKAFNQAFKNEGWDEGDWENGIFGYMWLVKTKNGYKRSDITDLKAELYTVGEW